MPTDASNCVDLRVCTPRLELPRWLCGAKVLLKEDLRPLDRAKRIQAASRTHTCSKYHTFIG